MERQVENYQSTPEDVKRSVKDDHPPPRNNEENDHPLPRNEEQQTENDHPTPSGVEQQSENGHPTPCDVEQQTQKDHPTPSGVEQQSESGHPTPCDVEQQTKKDHPTPSGVEQQSENGHPTPNGVEQQTENVHPARRAGEKQRDYNFVVLALAFLENNDFLERCQVPYMVFHAKFTKVVDQSLAYVKTFGDLCFFGQDKDRVKRIKVKVQCNDCGELTVFKDQLKTVLEKLQKSYENVETVTNDFMSTVHEATQNCQNLEKRENRKKHATRAVGGAATAGLLAVGVGTGVTLSIVAGVFTFGVGTIVGLSLTAAGAAVVGTGIATGTGAATYFMASHFAEEESKCTRLSQFCHNLQLSASCMNHKIHTLGLIVESIETSLVIVHKTQKCHNETPSLLKALDGLWQKFNELDYDFVALQKELETRRNEVLQNHRP